DVFLREPAAATMRAEGVFRTGGDIRTQADAAIVETKRGVFDRRFHDVLFLWIEAFPVRAFRPIGCRDARTSHDLFGEGLVAGRDNRGRAAAGVGHAHLFEI